jgi:hypothetical protein
MMNNTHRQTNDTNAPPNRPMPIANKVFMIAIIVIIVGIGARIAFTSGLLSTLQCQRGQAEEITCHIQAGWFGLGTFDQRSLAGVQTASIEEDYPDPAEGLEYAVEMRGEEPYETLTLQARDEQEAEQHMQAIAAFLENSNRQSLEVGMPVRPTNIMGVVFGGFIVVFFSVIILLILFQDRIYQRATLLYGDGMEG